MGGAKGRDQRMVDLEEAARSFTYFSDLLDHQCSLYNAAVGFKSDGAAKEVAELQNVIIIKLHETVKNSHILDIVVSQAMTTEAERMAQSVLPLARMIAATNRLVIAQRKASALIDEHERTQEKNVPAEENPTAVAIRKFLEEHGYRSRH